MLRRLTLVQRINASIAVIAIVAMLLTLLTSVVSWGFLRLTVVAALQTISFLLAFRSVKWAAHFTILSLLLGFLTFPVLPFVGYPETHLFLVLFLSPGITSSIYVLLRGERTIGHIAFWLAATAVHLPVTINILLSRMVQGEAVTLRGILTEDPMIFISFGLGFIFIHVSLLLYRTTVLRQQRVIQTSHATLIEKHEEIRNQKSELEELHSQAARWNELLEQKILERTSELQSKNDRLLQYSYLNSHELRAPVARAMMLLEVLDREENPQLRLRTLSDISDSLSEIDSIIRRIARVIDDNDPELLREIGEKARKLAPSKKTDPD